MVGEHSTTVIKRSVGNLTWLFTHNLHDQFTVSGTGIKIHQNDLLPCPEQQRTGRKRNGDGRPLELSSKMTVAVVFSRIDLVVSPPWVRRNDSIPKRFRVCANARLILNNHDGGSRVPDEDRQNSGVELGADQSIGNGFRDVLDLRITFHTDRQRNSVDTHSYTPAHKVTKVAAIATGQRPASRLFQNCIERAFGRQQPDRVHDFIAQDAFLPKLVEIGERLR